MITPTEVEALIDGVSWINWAVTTHEPFQDGRVQTTLRPAIDEEYPALRAKAGSVYSSWVTVALMIPVFILVGIGSLGGVGLAIAIVLGFAAIGGLIQLVSAPAGLAVVVIAMILAAGSFLLDARRNRYVRTVHCVAVWLRTAPVLTERVSSTWADALDDPETREQIIEWMLSRPEIDALESHIAEGVHLRKHLSPVDPRRRTMRAEIGARRSKRDALVELREHRADSISESAESYTSLQAQAREAQIARAKQAREEKLAQEKFQQRLREVAEVEQRRVKTHEKIDEWFDRDH